MEPVAFPVFTSPIVSVWNIVCVKIFNMNRYISNSYTKNRNTIDRLHTERGGGNSSVNYRMDHYIIFGISRDIF